MMNGQHHREDGPATVYKNGHLEWWINGKQYRLDGPAVIWPNGNQQWWVNGLRHRLDGPAYIGLDGSHSQEWWVNGNYITEEVHAWIIENNIPKDFSTWNTEHKVLFRLRF